MRVLIVLAICLFSISASPVLAQAPQPAPPIGATQLPASADMDKLVASVANILGLTNTTYEGWQLPASSTWDDTFKYYSDQMVQAGWSGQGVTQDFSGGKVGVWTNTATQTALVIFYLAGNNSTYDLAIFGTVAAAQPAATTTIQPSGLINSVTMAAGTTGPTNDPVNPTSVFPASSTFHAVVATNNAPANTKFTAKWYVTDVGSAASPNTLVNSTDATTDGTRNLDFTLTPTSTWAIGKYRVEISVNDQLDQVVQFSVQ
jgi:hypothetical protein